MKRHGLYQWEWNTKKYIYKKMDQAIFHLLDANTVTVQFAMLKRKIKKLWKIWLLVLPSCRTGMWDQSSFVPSVVKSELTVLHHEEVKFKEKSASVA